MAGTNLIRDANGNVVYIKCSSCSEVLETIHFHRDNTSPGGSGFQRQCKLCQKQAIQKRRDAGKGKKPTAAQRFEALKVWRAKNPEKVKAHAALARAIRSGKIKKQPCEVCGKTNRVEGHHDDYSKPLEVRWLCRKHHAEEHHTNGIPDVPFIDFKLYPRAFVKKNANDFPDSDVPF